MKIGIRTPSINKRIKARTTGKAKRALKRSVNPLYGKKGMGWVNNPKKAMYNKVYNKTSVSVDDSLMFLGGVKKSKQVKMSRKLKKQVNRLDRMIRTFPKPSNWNKRKFDRHYDRMLVEYNKATDTALKQKNLEVYKTLIDLSYLNYNKESIKESWLNR